jgi:hypothetical protein
MLPSSSRRLPVAATLMVSWYCCAWCCSLSACRACRSDGMALFPPPWSRDVVWLKGNAHEKFALNHSRGAASAGFQPWSPSIVRSGYRGTDVHGTQRTQKIDAAFLAAYLIVIATAATVILIHPKPALIPLLLWYAGRPL